MADVTYAGVPFLQNHPGVDEWIALNFSLDLERITLPYRSFPAPNLLGLAYPAKYPARPRLKLGQFFYPTGCSRFGEYNGLASADQALAMFAAAYPGGAAVANPFVFTVNGEGVETDLYMLPPKALNGFSSFPAYLITLVDERYFPRASNQQSFNLDNSTTWDNFFQGLANTALDINLVYSVIDSVYQNPDPDSDLNYQTGENAWIILESAAAMVGRTVVRNFDGSYSMWTADEANEIKAENLAGVTSTLAGADALDPDGSAFGIIPAFVQVSFPKVVLGSWYTDDNSTHLRGPINCAQDVYLETIGITDVEGYDGIVGTANTKAFKDTCKAIYSDINNSDPDNQAILHALAVQIAQDYYDFRFSGLDVTLPGILNWTPDGLHDLIFTNNHEKCQTYVQCKPWNYDVEEMCHCTNKPNPMPFLEPGCWGKITARASSPDSTGYKPYSWKQQDPNEGHNPPWTDTSGGIVGTYNDQNPAYADNDDSATVGNVYWMRVGDNDNYRFSVGGGSGSGVTGTYDVMLAGCGTRTFVFTNGSLTSTTTP